ncbi:hypothetical protein EYF80_061390 [Liparis tanakae]|uniref:Uncharacterized protein n=1 Tax=Liparis tanakae TaxID=230148 RepID=A0A4Z2EJE6_9TELE|nr:hypothetical protein EYF80_061390 [Liparis tanakae]
MKIINSKPEVSLAAGRRGGGGDGPRAQDFPCPVSRVFLSQLRAGSMFTEEEEDEEEEEKEEEEGEKWRSEERKGGRRRGDKTGGLGGKETSGMENEGADGGKS